AQTSMPTARAALAVVVGGDGKNYVIGGSQDLNHGLQTVEAYDPASKTWSCSIGDTSPSCTSNLLAPMPTGRNGGGAAVGGDGRAYNTGGENSGVPSLEAYNFPSPATATATPTSTPTATATPTSTPIPMNTATATPTAVPTATATNTP